MTVAKSNNSDTIIRYGPQQRTTNDGLKQEILTRINVARNAIKTCFARRAHCRGGFHCFWPDFVIPSQPHNVHDWSKIIRTRSSVLTSSSYNIPLYYATLWKTRSNEHLSYYTYIYRNCCCCFTNHPPSSEMKGES